MNPARLAALPFFLFPIFVSGAAADVAWSTMYTDPEDDWSYVDHGGSVYYASPAVDVLEVRAAENETAIGVELRVQNLTSTETVDAAIFITFILHVTTDFVDNHTYNLDLDLFPAHLGGDFRTSYHENNRSTEFEGFPYGGPDFESNTITAWINKTDLERAEPTVSLGSEIFFDSVYVSLAPCRPDPFGFLIIGLWWCSGPGSGDIAPHSGLDMREGPQIWNPGPPLTLWWNQTAVPEAPPEPPTVAGDDEDHRLPAASFLSAAAGVLLVLHILGRRTHRR